VREKERSGRPTRYAEKGLGQVVRRGPNASKGPNGTVPVRCPNGREAPPCPPCFSSWRIRAATELKPEDFELPAFQRVFEALVALPADADVDQIRANLDEAYPARLSWPCVTPPRPGRSRPRPRIRRRRGESARSRGISVGCTGFRIRRRSSAS
jgi:hypothetical protein